MAGRAAPDFRPGGQHGHVLTQEEYIRRRDETTKQELAKLQQSEEYKAWAAGRGRGTRPAQHASVSAFLPLVAALTIAGLTGCYFFRPDLLPPLGFLPGLVGNSTTSLPSLLTPEPADKASLASSIVPAKATSHSPATQSHHAAQTPPKRTPAAPTATTPVREDAAGDRPLEKTPAAQKPSPIPPSPEVQRLKEVLRKFQKQEVLSKEQAKKAQRQIDDLGTEIAQLRKHLDETGKAEQTATRNFAAAKAKVEELRAELADAHELAATGTTIQGKPRPVGDSQDGESLLDRLGDRTPFWSFKMFLALVLGAWLGRRFSMPGAVRRKERERLRAEVDARVMDMEVRLQSQRAYRQMAEGANEQLEQALAQATVAKESLRNRIAELETTLSNTAGTSPAADKAGNAMLTKEISILQAKVAELQRANKKKDDDLGNAQRRLDDLSNVHTQLTGESKTALDAKAVLEAKVKRLEEQVAKHEAQASDGASPTPRKDSPASVVRTGHSGARMALVTPPLKEESELLRQELSETQAEVLALKGKLEAAEKELLEATRELQATSSRNAAYEPSDASRSRAKGLQEQIETLKVKNNGLEEEVHALRTRIERDALPSPDQVRGTLTARVNELTAQNEALTRQLEVSFEAMQAISPAHDPTVSRELFPESPDGVQAGFDAATATKDALQLRLASMQAEMSETRAAVDALREERDALADALDATRNMPGGSGALAVGPHAGTGDGVDDNDPEALRARVAQMTAGIAEIISYPGAEVELERRQRQVDELTAAQDDLQRCLAELQEQLSRAEAALKAKEQEIEELQGEVAVFQAQLEELQSELTRREAETLGLQKAKEEVEQALANQSGEAARVDEENVMLKAQLEQVTGTLMEEQAAKLEANRHLSEVQRDANEMACMVTRAADEKEQLEAEVRRLRHLQQEAAEQLALQGIDSPVERRLLVAGDGRGHEGSEGSPDRRQERYLADQHQRVRERINVARALLSGDNLELTSPWTNPSPSPEIYSAGESPFEYPPSNAGFSSTPQPGDRALQQQNYMNFVSQASVRVGEMSERLWPRNSPNGQPRPNTELLGQFNGGQASRQGYHNQVPNRGAGGEPPWGLPRAGPFPSPSGDRYGGQGSAGPPWGSASTRRPSAGYETRASQGFVRSSDEDDDDDEGSESEYEGDGDSDDEGGIDEGLPHSEEVSRTLAELRKYANMLSLHELNNRRTHTFDEMDAVQRRLEALREQKSPGRRPLAGWGDGITEIERAVAGAKSDIDLLFREIVQSEAVLVDCVRRRVAVSHEVGAANAQVQQLDLAMQMLKQKRANADSVVVQLKEGSVEASRYRAMAELKRDHFKKEYEDGNNKHLLDQVVLTQSNLEHALKVEQTAAQGLEEAQTRVLAIIPEQNETVTAFAYASSHAQATYRAETQAKYDLEVQVFDRHSKQQQFDYAVERAMALVADATDRIELLSEQAPPPEDMATPRGGGFDALNLIPRAKSDPKPPIPSDAGPFPAHRHHSSPTTRRPFSPLPMLQIAQQMPPGPPAAPSTSPERYPSPLPQPSPFVRTAQAVEPAARSFPEQNTSGSVPPSAAPPFRSSAQEISPASSVCASSYSPPSSLEAAVTSWGSDGGNVNSEIPNPENPEIVFEPVLALMAPHIAAALQPGIRPPFRNLEFPQAQGVSSPVMGPLEYQSLSDTASPQSSISSAVAHRLAGEGSLESGVTRDEVSQVGRARHSGRRGGPPTRTVSEIVPEPPLNGSATRSRGQYLEGSRPSGLRGLFTGRRGGLGGGRARGTQTTHRSVDAPPSVPSSSDGSVVVDALDRAWSGAVRPAPQSGLPGGSTSTAEIQGA